MQTVAMGWLVIELTGSGGLLGLVTAAQFLPVLILGPIAGAISDRRSRWHMLQTTQVLAGLLAGVLGVMVATDTIQVWSLFVLAALIGTVNSFDTPVRSAFMYEIVGPDDITGAVGVGSTVNNVSRIVGPALAGLVIATLGIAACFFANALSFVACIVTFLLMRRAEFQPKPPSKGSKGQVRAGLRVVWVDPRLRTPMLMTLVIGTLAYENQIALPLHGQVHLRRQRRQLRLPVVRPRRGVGGRRPAGGPQRPGHAPTPRPGRALPRRVDADRQRHAVDAHDGPRPGGRRCRQRGLHHHDLGHAAAHDAGRDARAGCSRSTSPPSSAPRRSVDR